MLAENCPATDGELLNLLGCEALLSVDGILNGSTGACVEWFVAVVVVEDGCWDCCGGG